MAFGEDSSDKLVLMGRKDNTVGKDRKRRE